MARHLFTVLCRNAVVDRERNSLSIFDVVEELHAETSAPPPAPGKIMGFPFEMVVVTVWVRDVEKKPEKARYRLRLFAPDGAVRIDAPPQPINLEPSRLHRALARLEAFPYSGDGVYRFEIARQKGNSWEAVAEIPLPVKLVTISRPESLQ